MRIVAFVPMKLNNERFPGKNTQRLSDGTPLYHCILRTLLASPVEAVYVYCNAPEIRSELPSGVEYLARDTRLDTSSTTGNDLAAAFAHDVVADAYVKAHATAPFLSASSIGKLVDAIRGGKHDSSLPVVKLQEFLWQAGRPINYDPTSIPRTQDLAPLYQETTGAYAYTRELAVTHRRRIGETPKLIEVSKIEALDVNEPIDFTIADAVHTRLSH